jgi:MYXO-CTERM domain-containing protein
MLAGHVANAEYHLVSSRAGFAGSELLDWHNAGPNGASFTKPLTLDSQPSNVPTVVDAGVGARIFSNINDPFVEFGWAGNFSLGDAVLYTNQGGIRLDFGAFGVRAAGAQIMADFYGPFIARLTAYNAEGKQLATFTRSGVSNRGAEGSAIFLGLTGDTAEIRTLKFTLDTALGDANKFAINQVSFTDGELVTATPEPGTAALALLGVGTLFAWRRRASRPRRGSVTNRT